MFALEKDYMFKIFQKNHTPEQKKQKLLRQAYNAHRKHLYNKRDPDGVYFDAIQLSNQKEYAHLSNAELIRLAYWGASGDVDHYGRADLRGEVYLGE